MTALNAEQVLHLLMESSIEQFDSGEGTDIKDPTFPLPQPDYSTESEIVPMKTVSLVTQIS